MTPEELARRKIDQQLEQCGWLVQDYASMHISAGSGIAAREFPLISGLADYLLYVDGKAIGVIEAKPEGHTLKGVELQSAKYTAGPVAGLPKWRFPLPFAYESTGTVTQFTSLLDPDPCSREIFTFHRPDELRRLAGLDSQLRSGLRAMPPLVDPRLWRVQVEAVANLECSLSENRPRALIQMATGSGKTYTACSFCYRLLAHAKARRILFLVDRNNLGKQAFNEFQQYESPTTRYKFTEEFPVQRLTGQTIDPASKVVITTIQRLYSILKGEPEFDEENEEDSLFEAASPLVRAPLPVVYNPSVPIETFDIIVIDECHRSIYNVWRQVLEYFDSFLIGLTATPTPQTIGFFRGNVVQDYSHEKAVADGVNVGYEVYRIRTRIGEGGCVLPAEAGRFVPHRNRRTLKKRLEELEDDLTYTAQDLDRDVANPSQIRTVIRTFKEKLPEIFPGRTEVPKTLVFAKNDLHADDIVSVIREEFSRGNDFCVKITSKTTGRKPEDLLNELRNSYMPRIAVTVDMIATGTDVKALECLLFMRNIASASYFEQMKGRGTRVIGEDDLRRVSPDTSHKTHFVIVDAVGVCVRDKTTSKPLDRQPSVPLDKLLASVGAGMVHADIVSTLAARLGRLSREITTAQAAEIAEAAGGVHLPQLVAGLLESIDDDLVDRDARERFAIPEDQEPTEAQLDKVEHERMELALKPFLDPKLRRRLLEIKGQAEQVIDEINQDELLGSEFDEQAKEKARTILEDFQRFCREHREDIEAIRLLYSRPYRAGLRYRQVKELAEALKRPPLSLPRPEERLWRLYEALEPDKVKGKGGRKLVDLIALVRHALHPEEPIIPVDMDVEERYRTWLAEQAAAGQTFTPEQLRWLEAIRNHIAASLAIDQDSFEDAPFAQMGGLGKVYQVFGDKLSGLLEELNARLAA